MASVQLFQRFTGHEQVVLGSDEKGKVFLRATIKGAKDEADPDRTWQGTLQTPAIRVDWSE